MTPARFVLQNKLVFWFDLSAQQENPHTELTGER